MMERRHKGNRKSIFGELMQGLHESLAHARGEMTLRTTTLPAPAPRFSKTLVIAIRQKMRMSQAVFAGYLNVPTRTLQSWEQGAREPKAGEARLLQVFEAAPQDFLRLVGHANGEGPRRARRRIQGIASPQPRRQSA